MSLLAGVSPVFRACSADRGKHPDHDAGRLGFDHVFDAGAAARDAPGRHRRGGPCRACRPVRAHGRGRPGRAAGQTLEHGRGAWPGAGRAVARLRPGRRVMAASGPW